jgi:hypothetical protein
MAGRHERIVAACRAIRRYAASGPGVEAGLFTYSHEVLALWELRRYADAWRRARERHAIVFGERLDLRREGWPIEMASLLEYDYAPILYFLGRYRTGCSLLETALDFRFDGTKVRSYDLLFRIDNGDAEPQHLYQVTLKHFYDRLGRELREWRHWGAFVEGFHPRLFRLAGVPREELLADASRLTAFVDRLLEVREERVTSGVGGSQSDLVDSPAKVRRRQEALTERLEQHVERTAPARERIDAKLETRFPELAALRRPPLRGRRRGRKR